VRAALDRAWRHSVGSSAAGKLRAAAESMLMGAADVPINLRIRREDPPAGLLSFTLPRTGARPEELLGSREVEGVPVIRIRQWSNIGGVRLLERFEAELERWRVRPGLIVDVRGNGGGSDELADQVVGRFLQAPIISSIFFQRLAPGQTFERMVMTARPRGPWRYEGRVVVLTDEGCMSACEHFVSGMIEAGAVTCGSPTSGACGWIRSVELPGGVHLKVSRTYPLHTGGVPSPLLGIPPHLWAPRTLGDVRAGKDTALNAALRWVRSSVPPPLRLQPVAPLESLNSRS
jgi:C-terminal processing protease CtpA/Prc